MSMDVALETWVSGLIELSKVKWMLGAGERWKPGRKLRLLFAGYNGTRNTGSDVRVEEMLRQIRHILGADNVQLSVMTQDPKLTEGYFDGVNQVLLPQIFPPFLYHEVPQHDGVVACEGSMFKSKFANALTTMMIGSLGIAAAQNKLSMGYGAEAGYMDRTLANMCARYCKDSMIITRNEESQDVLGKLGVATELGTDTAWTFEPLPTEFGRNVLRKAGWDGTTPVLVICPVNPFWWPVKPSLMKLAARTVTGAYKESHYRSIYFHNDGPEVARKYESYINAISNAVDRYRQERKVFVALVATERLDIDSCKRMSEKLGGVPFFSSAEYNMYELVSILRATHLMVSSRFHGIVTCMPEMVPSAGVTIDERIKNLMREREHNDLLLTDDDPELEEKLIVIMRKLMDDQERIRVGIGKTVARNLKLMAKMGVYFEEQLLHVYPEFPRSGSVKNWEDYLPPMSPALTKLMESYG